MSAIQIIILVIFGVDSLIHLYGQYIFIKGKEKLGKLIEYITKPLLLPLIIAFYLTYLPAVNWWYIAGMIGGFLGDVFLMLPDPSGKKTSFKIGLIAFLLGHVFYVVALIQNYVAWLQISWEAVGFPWLPLVLAVAFIVYGLIIGFLLLPHCGKLKIAVLVYLIVIVLMGISTTIIGWKGMKPGVITLIVGASLFVVSDTYNAFGRFVKPIPNERLIVMSTYIIGQFLMLLGYIIISELTVFS